jgi:hypothetical protein
MQRFEGARPLRSQTSGGKAQRGQRWRRLVRCWIRPLPWALCVILYAVPAGAQSLTTARRPRRDDADSSRVARELRRLRVAEAGRLQRSGNPAILPTGHCTADITLNEASQPQNDFVVDCNDPRLMSDMRQAVVAVLPLQAVGPTRVQLRVEADDAEPVGPQANIDQRESMLVKQELLELRHQQIMQQQQAGLTPPRPLFGTCTATVQLSSEAGSPPASSTMNCSDPRLEPSMHRAILAAAVLSTQSGSTLHLHVNGIFPAP